MTLQSQSRVQAVAFDMDGLMFNTEDVYWKAADQLLRRRGHSYTDELAAAIMGRPPKDCFEKFINHFDLPDTWYDLQTESEELFLALLTDGYDTMPGLWELLEFLEEQRVPKCVCTSSSRRVAEAVLRGKNVWHRFDFILTAEDIRHGKPAPDIYLMAAARFQIVSPNMLVLEDSVAGSCAAIAAGSPLVVLRSTHNRDLDFSFVSTIVESLNSHEIRNMSHKQ